MQPGEPTCGISPAGAENSALQSLCLGACGKVRTSQVPPRPSRDRWIMSRFGTGEMGTGIALTSAKGVHHGSLLAVAATLTL